ncbi:aminotransferase class V-fold PLP-dependent enzyme [Sphingobium sp. CR2-8]|uniref:aminotransferase class V-fold PLP-dependent enzyme n=1 Tax=Sphingobium sp. CR2-8 TaxID=1306534 RepID=UPI002DBA8E6C|nr:aminotransferase class V-fold PLP-dependent enzyme [Sphingobium sp. CR2-8]MEC3909170.1 aminotransferase class V-fold PLP-dependent enzyme [Sphingobium sp. CR2-8]
MSTATAAFAPFRHSAVPTPIADIGAIARQDGDRDAHFWEALRAQYSVSGGLAYLDNAAYSPPPNLILETQERWQHQLSANPANPMRLGELEPVRANIADAIGGSEEEITLTRSTTEGFSLLLYGFDWHAGDEILFDGGDHPSIRAILEILQRRYGVRAIDAGLGDDVPGDDAIVARYTNKLTAHTRLVLLSHVNGWTGRRMPVRRIADAAHASGALVALDASQSFGALHLSVGDLSVDFVAAPGHKWAAAGHGGGFAYFRHATQAIVWPTVGGGYDPKSTSPFDQSARRLDRNAGQKNIPFLLGFDAAVEWHKAVGQHAIERRILDLSAYLRAALAVLPTVRILGDLEQPPTSPLTLFSVEGHSAQEVRDILHVRENVHLGLIGEGADARLRVSPHIHNSFNDIDRVAWALARIAAA